MCGEGSRRVGALPAAPPYFKWRRMDTALGMLCLVVPISDVFRNCATARSGDILSVTTFIVNILWCAIHSWCSRSFTAFVRFFRGESSTAFVRWVGRHLRLHFGQVHAVLMVLSQSSLFLDPKPDQGTVFGRNNSNCSIVVRLNCVSGKFSLFLFCQLCHRKFPDAAFLQGPSETSDCASGR